MTQAKIQHLSDELSQSDEPGWMEKEGLLLVASALNGRRFSLYPESPGPWLDSHAAGVNPAKTAEASTTNSRVSHPCLLSLGRDAPSLRNVPLFTATSIHKKSLWSSSLCISPFLQLKEF